MASVENYTATEYFPPGLVQVVGGLLEIPRESRSTSFSDLFSSDQATQRSYVNGLVGLGSFLLSLLFLWYLVLLVLKLKGHELGCAGGHAFTTRTSSKAESFTDSDESSSNNKKSENSDDDRFSARFLGGSRRDLPKESSSRGCCPNSGLHVQRRKLRTRMVFLFFAFISLFCSVLIVTRTYHQLQTATDNVSKVIDEGEEIVGSVDSVIEAVGSAIQIADNILETIPLEFAQLCPDVPPEFFKPQLGVDPRDVVSFLDREYNPFIVYAQENMGALQEVTVQFRGILGDIDNVTQESEDRLWVLPMLIMCITIFTVFSAIGTLVAIYREAIAGSKPTPCDKFLSWFILPAMIMWTILAWTLVICFCFGTVLTSDVCVSSGGPDVMIQNILEAHHVDPDTTTFSLIAAYTGGCKGENPVQEIVDAEIVLEDHLLIMRTRLGEAEDVGYDFMEQKCGEENHITPFFNGLLQFENQLTAVRVALGDASTMLSCPKINSLYISAVHDSFCTDFAAANANGFILFLLVSMSSMIIVTLRASWRVS